MFCLYGEDIEAGTGGKTTLDFALCDYYGLGLFFKFLLYIVCAAYTPARFRSGIDLEVSQCHLLDDGAFPWCG